MQNRRTLAVLPPGAYSLYSCPSYMSESVKTRILGADSMIRASSLLIHNKVDGTLCYVIVPQFYSEREFIGICIEVFETPYPVYYSELTNMDGARYLVWMTQNPGQTVLTPHTFITWRPSVREPSPYALDELESTEEEFPEPPPMRRKREPSRLRLRALCVR